MDHKIKQKLIEALRKNQIEPLVKLFQQVSEDINANALEAKDSKVHTKKTLLQETIYDYYVLLCTYGDQKSLKAVFNQIKLPDSIPMLWLNEALKNQSNSDGIIKELLHYKLDSKSILNGFGLLSLAFIQNKNIKHLDKFLDKMESQGTPIIANNIEDLLKKCVHYGALEHLKLLMGRTKISQQQKNFALFEASRGGLGVKNSKLIVDYLLAKDAKISSENMKKYKKYIQPSIYIYLKKYFESMEERTILNDSLDTKNLSLAKKVKL